MSDNTKISWADASWNPIIGCSKISSGCANCFAEKMAIRLRGMGQEQYSYVVWPKHFEGAENKKGWNGKTFFVESALTKPLHWRKPRKIFVNSMGDTWHKSVPFEWIDRIMAVAALCPQHTFLFLTKRAERMREYCDDLLARTPGMDKTARAMGLPHNQFMYPGGVKTGVYQFNLPLPNIHLGVTVENQKNVGRIETLRQTPAASRFLSLEPLLESLWLTPAMLEGIDSVFVGPESGPGARLCSLDNIRDVMQQCWDANVKVHVKQIPLDGKCNKNFDEWPPEFQVREI